MPRNICQMAIKKRIMTAKVIGYMKPDIDPNTRLYVPFNEGVGDLAKDYSQYCNHAQLTDVEWSPDGFNGAGEFNGSSSFGNCGNDASLNITDEITIEVWPKVETLNVVNPLVSKWLDSWANAQYNFEIHTSNKLRIGFGDGTNYRRFKASTETTLGRHYYTGVIVGSNDMRLYQDGISLSGTYDGAATSTWSTNNYVKIGRYGAFYFNGIIDNVIISSTAKSVAQTAADCYEVVCN